MKRENFELHLGESFTSSIARSTLINLSSKYINGTVLDIGCGVGKLSDIWAREAKEYLGTDMNIVYLREAKSRFHSKNPASKSLFVKTRNFPFKPASFDSIILFHVLEHIKVTDQRMFIEGIHRILKPGAPCLVGVPLMEWSGRLIYKIWQRININPCIMIDHTRDTSHCVVFTRNSLDEIMADSGFEISGNYTGNIRLLNRYNSRLLPAIAKKLNIWLDIVAIYHKK